METLRLDETISASELRIVGIGSATIATSADTPLLHVLAGGPPVTLRGLTFEGRGHAAVAMESGTLHVEDCTFKDFKSCLHMYEPRKLK